MNVARRWILPVIVIAQFACTSIWFAGNAVMKELIAEFRLPQDAAGHLTSAVQFGFISGTLCYAILMIADRFPPSRVFFFSAVAGAISNLAVISGNLTLGNLLLLRVLAGFFLAGIYPVGMKIAADYYEKGLGKALGYLVGALVIGTAFPHLIRSIIHTLPWKLVIIITSSICCLGGLVMLVCVPNGPYRKKSQGIHLQKLYLFFRNMNFRSASFGYFGHMWELYTFWAFVPILLSTYNNNHNTSLDVSLFSFVIIAVGAPACVAGGYLSQKYGARRIAAAALALSALCCIVSPIMIYSPSEFIFVAFLICWGMAVIADSPLFSSMVAQYADPESKGTALTLVTCIGFTITIASIQVLTFVMGHTGSRFAYMLLAAGPVLGLIALLRRRA